MEITLGDLITVQIQLWKICTCYKNSAEKGELYKKKFLVFFNTDSSKQNKRVVDLLGRGKNQQKMKKKIK